MQTVRRLADDLPHRQVCTLSSRARSPLLPYHSGHVNSDGRKLLIARLLTHGHACSLALSTMEQRQSSLQRKLRPYRG